jgi:hypothetical protein
MVAFSQVDDGDIAFVIRAMFSPYVHFWMFG